jgi:hypothetical protein
MSANGRSRDELALVCPSPYNPASSIPPSTFESAITSTPFLTNTLIRIPTLHLAWTDFFSASPRISQAHAQSDAFHLHWTSPSCRAPPRLWHSFDRPIIDTSPQRSLTCFYFLHSYVSLPRNHGFPDFPRFSQHNMSAHIPPTYEQLFPESDTAMSNFIRGRRETRYTTITLREIHFPAGCPCHPKYPQKHSRPPTPPSREPWLPRGRPTLVERTGSTSSSSSASTTSQSSGESSRSRNQRPWDWLSRARTSSSR